MNNNSIAQTEADPEVDLSLIKAARLDARILPGGTDAERPSRPESIGSYKIIRLLGAGGMGVVYEAEQENPCRTVAVKVVRGGQFVDEHSLKLFHREALALARLKNTYIGSIYEAGRTEDGQHFFAMELVRGQRLTTHAERRELSLIQRLVVFRKVCEAIAYAHQRGVMHRDLKPSNILVDEEGNPKVLDFGLARITDSDIATTTVSVGIDKVAGTLPYMSPEQALGNPNDIDLRSDVYSLGVVLYELLTGRLPHDIAHTALPDAVRTICEEPPSRPSTLNRTLRGDLDTIILKALAREPSRRYQSASALADDIQRYLDSQPILARPPSVSYEFRKLVSRNKLTSAFVAAMLAVVLGFGVWMSVLYARAEASRADAVAARAEAQNRADDLKAITEFQESMLVGTDLEAMGQSILDHQRSRIRNYLARDGMADDEIDTKLALFDELVSQISSADLARQVIDETMLSQAASTIEADFSEKPVLKASIQQIIADAYRNLTLYDKALPFQESALKICRAELGNDHESTLIAIGNMAVLLHKMGNYEEAEKYYLESLELRRRVLGDDHFGTLAALSNIGSLYQKMGRLADAERYLRKALKEHRRVLGDDDQNTLTAIHNMGFLMHNMGKYAEAEEFYREALDGKIRTLGEDDRSTINTMGNLACLLQSVGNLDEAEELHIRVLKARRRVLGDDHSETLSSLNSLGYFYKSMGRYDDAEQCYREALNRRRALFGDEHPETLAVVGNLGSLLLEMDRLTEAEPLCRETLEGRRNILGNDHQHTLAAVNKMAVLLYKLEKYEEAEPLARETLNGFHSTLGEHHLKTISAINTLGAVLRNLSRFDEAEAVGLDAVDRARTLPTESQWMLGVSLQDYGKTLLDLGRHEDAEDQLIESHRILMDTLGAEHQKTISTAQALVDLYNDWHKSDPTGGHDAEARTWQDQQQ